METLKIHTKDKDQLRTVKTILKALKIPFESSTDSPYSQEFVAKIKESEQQLERGEKTTVNGTEELKQILGLE